MHTSSRKLCVAAVQMACDLGNCERNLSHAAGFVREAAEK